MAVHVRQTDSQTDLLGGRRAGAGRAKVNLKRKELLLAAAAAAQLHGGSYKISSSISRDYSEFLPTNFLSLSLARSFIPYLIVCKQALCVIAMYVSKQAS